MRNAAPVRLRASEFLLNLPGLWQQFNAVPEDFFKRDGDAALIPCPCGHRDENDLPHRVEFGDLLECPGCRRFYFMGRTLHAAKLDG